MRNYNVYDGEGTFITSFVADRCVSNSNGTTTFYSDDEIAAVIPIYMVVSYDE